MSSVPVENVIAAFPPSHGEGGIALHALTIRKAIVLAAMGADPAAKSIPPNRLAFAAFILASDNAAAASLLNGDTRGFCAFAKALPRDLSAIAKDVESVCRDAFATRVPAAAGAAAVVHATPHGPGWPLAMAEALCAEYGWTFDAALDMPLCSAFALIAAARERNGGRNAGPDYLERSYIERHISHRTSPIQGAADGAK